jgi:GntR family transcriptional repressor for pyruvate dehydrogenase complex
VWQLNFKPIKTKKIYEEIIEQVRGLIAEGALNPGDKLMSERELADQLKVGRSAVREAFRALEAMGIIEIKQGDGTFVKEISSQSLAEVLAMACMLDKETPRELMELRKILEVESAGLASVRHTVEELEKMENALKRMEGDLESGDLGEEADWLFHYSVAEATHNSLIIRLMDTIGDTMRTALKKARQELYQTPGTPQRLLREHCRIFNAIKQGKDKEARRAMFEHLDLVEKGMFK